MKEAFKEILEQIAKRCARHETLTGRLTLGLSLLIGVIGFPLQIYKNWLEQSCGIDVWIIVFAVLMYIVRIPYLSGKRAWYLIPTEFIGLLSTSILLWQWWIYT